MKLKKLPYYIAPWFLMAGASLTIGLLSFSGMMAIWPIVPLALGAFVLSVAYEGEIYLQNIKESFKKLFKTSHLERQLAKACLREHCFSDTPENSRPQFFKDYERQLRLLHRFDHKRLDKASSERKRHVEKTLGDMEKWFAKQLFSNKKSSTDYQRELHTWLNDDKRRKDNQMSLLTEFQAKRNHRHVIYQVLKAFCCAAGVFMALGTTYLLSEAFAVIPWLAALPVASLPIFIVPMAAIAGVAYGLLVYNAITDMIASEMVTTWFRKISLELANPKTWWSGVGKASVLSFMLLISLTLSVCTAGTWWTVVKSTRPLFDWMRKVPAFIMLVLNPLILSVSALAFNVENISETLEMVEPRIDEWLGDAPKPESANPVLTPDEKYEGVWEGMASLSLSDPDSEAQTKIIQSKDIVFVRKNNQIDMWYCDHNEQCRQVRVTNSKILDLVKTYAQTGMIINTTHLKEIKACLIASGMSMETWQKRWNPFRMFIDHVFYPLLKLLFAGHLASIAATADQVPGFSPLLPVALGVVSEGVEDLHRFEFDKNMPQEHKHDLPSLLNERLSANSGHEHGNDLPTKFLSVLFSPVYFLAACWEFLFTRGNDKWNSWKDFGATFEKAWNKETGVPDEETVEFMGVDPCCVTVEKEKPARKDLKPSVISLDTQEYCMPCMPSKRVKPRKKVQRHTPFQKPQGLAWQFEHAAYRIERYKEKTLYGEWAGREIAEQQIDKLNDLQKALYRQSDDARAVKRISVSVEAVIDSHLKEPDYNKHRFFLYEPSGKTDTREFLDGLSERVAMAG